tara:strand:- start:469 stop:654 length:186 start_codon:yes stop_codon:yes gene_type:complete
MGRQILLVGKLPNANKGRFNMITFQLNLKTTQFNNLRKIGMQIIKTKELFKIYEYLNNNFS